MDWLKKIIFKNDTPLNNESDKPDVLKGNRRMSYDLIDVSSRYEELFKPRVIDRNLINLFHDIVEIQHPVRLIVDRCLNAKINLYRYKDDSIVWDNEKINKFLSQPNALYDFDEFFTSMLIYYLVTGNSYMSSDFDSISTSRWRYADNYYILPSDYVDIELQNLGKIDAFTFQEKKDIIKQYTVQKNGSKISYDPDTILHIKDVNINFNSNAYKGKSKLDSCIRPISNLIAQYEARNIIYVKRGALGAIVSRKYDAAGSVKITEEEKEGIRNSFHETYGVTGGRNPLAIIDADVDFVKFSMSIDELKPFEEYLSDTVAIASALNVPPNMAIRKDQSTFSNQEIGEISLYQNVAIPLTNKIISAIDNYLGLKDSGLYLKADFSHISQLQGNKKDEAVILKFNTESFTKLYENNSITYNEMRVGLGYERIEGMDKLKNEIDKAQ